MTISNYNNGQYIKIQSEYITSLFQNGQPYTLLEIGVNLNCCGIDTTEAVQTATIFTAQQWQLDLDFAQKLNQKLQAITLYNTQTGQSYNPIITPVDLAYVESNCATESCTLETFASHFAPLIKDQIDDFFASLGLTTDVEVLFDENTVLINDLPAYFIIKTYSVGNAIPYTDYLAGFGSTYGKAFLVDNALYIAPQFFNIEDKVRDGIYSISLKYYKADNSWVNETGCAFIDVTTKCKVAAMLQNILEENNNSHPDKPSTIVHLLHYALVNGSNCNCNCNELCEIYTELFKLLNDNPKLVNTNCGC